MRLERRKQELASHEEVGAVGGGEGNTKVVSCNYYATVISHRQNGRSGDGGRLCVLIRH